MIPKVHVVITRKLRIPFTWRNRFKDSKKKSKESKKKLKEAKQKTEMNSLEKFDRVKKLKLLKKIQNNRNGETVDTRRGAVIKKQPKLNENQRKIKQKREKQRQSKTIKPKKKGGKGKATPTLSALTKVINLFFIYCRKFHEIIVLYFMKLLFILTHFIVNFIMFVVYKC